MSDEGDPIAEFSADGFASFHEWWDYMTDLAQYEQDRSDHDFAGLG